MPENQFVFAGAPYSNSAPLMDQLEKVDPRVRVIKYYPARLAQALKTGKADVALIPVAHLFSHQNFTRIKGLGVAAEGPVRSVLLKCTKPLEKIGNITRDPASATSNALVELLMRRYFNRHIRMYDVHKIVHPDAMVLIGDRALRTKPAPAGDIDLAEAWREMTGLPFVFAVWAVRKDFAHIREVTEIAHKAYAEGTRAIGRIAAHYAGILGGAPAFWKDYLAHSIHYNLGPRDIKGLRLFRSLLTLKQTQISGHS